MLCKNRLTYFVNAVADSVSVFITLFAAAFVREGIFIGTLARAVLISSSGGLFRNDVEWRETSTSDNFPRML